MEDDQCMRELLLLHLSNAGYKVLVAGDAFLRAVKADRTTRAVPVIFVTVRVEAEAQAKKLGAAAFLTKPLLLSELPWAVAQQIERRVAA